jgi:DNA gyrase/topoisomerase IV subunit A
MSADGLLSRTHDEKPPRLSGSDAPRLLVRANSTDTLYLASGRGLAAAVAVHTLPEAEKLSDGAPFYKLSPLKEADRPLAAFALPKRSNLPEETCVLTITRGGMLKKSLVSELPGPSAQTFYMCKVNDGDTLGWVVLTDGKKELLLATATGMAIRFGEEDIRPMGLVAAGVNGVKLGVGDEVVGAEIVNGSENGKADKETDVFLVSSDGKAKRVSLAEFPTQGRYGKGVIAWDLPLGAKLAGMAIGKGTHVITLHLRKAAPKMTRLDEAGMKKRAATRGDTVVEVKPGDAVIALTDAWMAERFVALKDSVVKAEKKEEKSKKVPGVEQLELIKSTNGKKPMAKVSDKKEVKSEKAKPVAAKSSGKVSNEKEVKSKKGTVAEVPPSKTKKPSATATSKTKEKPAAKPAPKSKTSSVKKPAAKKK